ncbi:MAG: hypothetical protein AB1758_01455 [Candidatus Eremiobacterota bacterium]
MRRRLWTITLTLVAVLLALPVLAAAPQALSVIINGYQMRGKALWYKGKVYVPLEEVAAATGGTYQYDPSTGVATVSVGTPAPPPRREVQRPYIKVRWEKKYLAGTNAKVMTTIANIGDVPAENLEAICIFKDGYLRELTAVARPVGRLLPGESRTLEFNLFEGYSGYAGYTPCVDPLLYDKVLINGQWTRVSYELKFNYQ